MAKKRRRKRKKRESVIFKAAALVIGCLVVVSVGLLIIKNSNFRTIPVTEIEAKEYALIVTGLGETPVFPRGVSVGGTSIEGMTLEEAASMIQEQVQAMKNRAVTFSVFGTDLYQYNGEMLGVAWDNPGIMDEMSQALGSGNFIAQYRNQKDYELNPVDFSVEMSCDEEYLGQIVQQICGYYAAEVANPSCQVRNGQMTVTAGVVGRSFDVDAITQQCISLVNDFGSTELVTYDFPYVETQPQYPVDYLSFEWSVLGEYSTSNLGDSNRSQNISLSAERMNGTIVLPGEQASAMNNLYGEVSEEGGYVSAPTYSQGKQVNDISGGICQTTSTLYNALLRAEMKIVYRSRHSMLVSYVPPSLDAMVNTSGGDFLFKNSSDYPIYIESYTSNDTLVVRIWGKEDRPANRTVEFKSEILELEWPDPLYEDYVNDTIATVGLVDVALKSQAIVEAHPYVHSISYKIVYVDGAEQSREVITEDTYKKMSGEMYHASDCRVLNYPPVQKAGGVYQFLGEGYDLYHQVTFLNGQGWDANDPNGYYQQQ